MKQAFIIFLLIFFINSSHASILQENNTTEFEIKKDSVRIQTSNGVIFGIIFSPIGVEKKLPAVLCLQGGGDVGLNNYLYEAAFFAKNGMVALVCDKSGSGLSKTKKSWREQSFIDKTNEYNELFNWLSQQANVNPNEIGVHGMSEGGRLALNMAIEYPDKIAFVNAVSGPIESFKKNQLYAIRNLLLSRTADVANVDNAISIWNAYFNEVGIGKNISQETVNQINVFRALRTQINYLPNNLTQLPSRPLPQDIHFTLENKLDRIKCPVLFQYGALDILVNPVRSITLIPNNPKFEIKNYEKTDHSMNFENGNMQPKFIDDKKSWLVKIQII